LERGAILPLNTYLYHSGTVAVFSAGFGVPSGDGRTDYPEGLNWISGEAAYKVPPRLSQYPRPVSRSAGRGSSHKRFSETEIEKIDDFLSQLENAGFKYSGVGYRHEFSGHIRKDTLVGRAYCRVVKGEIKLSFEIGKYAHGVFRSKWSVMVHDDSRRDGKYTNGNVSVGSTLVCSVINLSSLDEALQHAELAIDRIIEKNRQYDEAHEA
jgi:hypothetical protein